MKGIAKPAILVLASLTVVLLLAEGVLRAQRSTIWSTWSAL
jgi:hypothetical protein